MTSKKEPIFQQWAEFTAIMDVLCQNLQDIGYANGLTKPAKMRLIELVFKLKSFAQAQSTSLKSSSSENIERYVFWESLLDIADSFISKAIKYYSMSYSEPNNDKKRYWLEMNEMWGGALDSEIVIFYERLYEMLDRVGARACFENIRGNDFIYVFELLGYKDDSEFNAYIFPKTQSIIRNKDPKQIALLETVIEKKSVNKSFLIEQGFTIQIIDDVLNALLFDNYLEQIDDATFKLTIVGLRVLPKLHESINGELKSKRNENKKKIRTEIIVAVIGLFGMISAALLTSWDKMFPPNEDGLSSVNVHTSSPNSSDSSKLAVPILTKPECSKTIKTPPNNSFLTLGWEPVPDAATYTVEIDCFGCSEYGRKWHSLAAEVPWHIKTGLGLRTPIYSSKIHVKKKESGGLALRWRVWAVDHNGTQGKKSNWCKLSFFGS